MAQSNGIQAEGHDKSVAWETFCMVRADMKHCACWYDDFGPCCGCGDDTHDLSEKDTLWSIK